MTSDEIPAFLAQHPKMAGVLFTAVLLQLRTGAATTRRTAYAGP